MEFWCWNAQQTANSIAAVISIKLKSQSISKNNKIDKKLKMKSINSRTRREARRKAPAESAVAYIFASPRGAVLSYKQKYRAKQMSYAASPW